MTRFAETIDQISQRIEAAIELKQNKGSGRRSDKARVT